MTQEFVEVTPVKGVTYDPQPGGGSVNPTKVWRTRVYANGKERTAGRYATVTEANEAMLAFYRRRDEMNRRCDFSDLMVGECYHCQGVNLPEARDRRRPGANPAPSGRRGRQGRPREVIIAHRDFTYPCTDCGGPFKQGDRMRAGVSNLLVHETCPTP